MEAQTERDHMTDNLFLYAVNTGELYKRHCDLARGQSLLHAWHSHVKDVVAPRYRRELGEDPKLSANMSLTIATRLRSYYEAHIKEGAIGP